MTKIAVLGSGANGASIGADLTRHGHDVVLIDQWPAHVEAMRTRGVRIEMPGEVLEQKVRALHLCDVCTLREPFDVVLLVMKAYDTRWATQLIAPYLKADGLVAGVQNGMTLDAIADVVGPERAMGCVIEISSAMFDPGVVMRHSPPPRSWFAVGSIHPSTKGREEEIASLLRCSGRVDVVEDIRAIKWMKLVSNATTLVSTALLGLSMQEAAAIPEMRELMLRSGEEALAIGAALGHPMLPIFGMSPETMRTANRPCEVLLDTLLAGFTLPHSTTTVLQDWQKGRHSEVDDLNGLVTAEAACLGHPVPVNSAITALAHLIEKGNIVPAPSNLERLLSMLH